jgi:hypothetical protein
VTEALDRFRTKCRFDPGTGCVIWTGGTSSARDGTERTGVFWDRGRKVSARRWAAEHIHGLDLMGKEATVTCHNPLCVEHVATAQRAYPHRQFYVMRDLGYAELDERKAPAVDPVPFHQAPAWLSPAVRVTRESPENSDFSSDGTADYVVGGSPDV